jgi:threonine/homoserine/homoserine lactone efflux protein
MLGIHDFGIFLATGVLLNLTPGQDTLYIVGRAMSQGRAVGVASALGVGAGCLVHTVATALGVSAVLAASSSAFTVLKLAGAAYLIYLGVGLLLTRRSAHDDVSTAEPVSKWTAFKQGVITNVTNPKVALFFLAFLPQFIDTDSPAKIAALLVLGLTFVATGTLWCLAVAVAAAAASKALLPPARTGLWLTRAVGALFIGLGARLVASE